MKSHVLLEFGFALDVYPVNNNVNFDLILKIPISVTHNSTLSVRHKSKDQSFSFPEDKRRINNWLGVTESWRGHNGHKRLIYSSTSYDVWISPDRDERSSDDLVFFLDNGPAVHRLGCDSGVAIRSDVAVEMRQFIILKDWALIKHINM